MTDHMTIKICRLILKYVTRHLQLKILHVISRELKAYMQVEYETNVYNGCN